MRWLVDYQGPEDAAPVRLGWTVEGRNIQEAAKALAGSHAHSQGRLTLAGPAPAFMDAPRYRGSGKRIPIAYIEATRPSLGLPTGPVAEVFLNDYGSKEISPIRAALADCMVAWLNDQDAKVAK